MPIVMVGQCETRVRRWSCHLHHRSCWRDDGYGNESEQANHGVPVSRDVLVSHDAQENGVKGGGRESHGYGQGCLKENQNEEGGRGSEFVRIGQMS